MLGLQCSARIPPRADHERVWQNLTLEVLKLDQQTVLFLNTPGTKAGPGVTLATLHFSQADLFAFIQLLIRG